MVTISGRSFGKSAAQAEQVRQLLERGEDVYLSQPDGSCDRIVSVQNSEMEVVTVLAEALMQRLGHDIAAAFFGMDVAAGKGSFEATVTNSPSEPQLPQIRRSDRFDAPNGRREQRDKSLVMPRRRRKRS